MISDEQLHSLAIFLGTLMMGMIVLYHFLAVNDAGSSSSSSSKSKPKPNSNPKLVKPAAAGTPGHRPATAVIGTK